jgi:hypothetical protein
MVLEVRTGHTCAARHVNPVASCGSRAWVVAHVLICYLDRANKVGFNSIAREMVRALYATRP